MLRILEISWLVVVLMSAGFGIYKTWTDGFVEALYIFLCTIISLLFYMKDRKQRIAMERQKEQDELQ
jgi:hypothetical protein